jgi:hypothetical protein
LDVTFDAAQPKRELLISVNPAVQTWWAAVNLQPLGDEDLTALGKLIHMGRLGRLRDWAHDLALRYPEHSGVARFIAQLADNAELDALEKLHKYWLELGAKKTLNIDESED